MSEQRDIAREGADADAISATGAPGAETTAMSVAAAVEPPPASDPSADLPAPPAVEPVADVVPAPVPRTSTPGTRLRERREERGIGVQQVTDSLHIEPRLVAALEADEFALFDAPVYARGFLRKYAAFLDLPSDEIVAGYDALHRGPDAPSLIPTASAAAPPRDWSAFKLPAVAAVLIAVIAGSYWWWMVRAPGAAGGSTTVALEAAAPTTPAAAPANSGPDGAAASTSAPVDPGAPPPDAAPTAGTSAVAPASTPPPASGAALPAGTPAVAPAPPSRTAGRGALEFRFSADCWIEVYGPAGERRLFDLVRAGESRAVSGPGPWTVFVGYADGVRVSIGGRSVPIPAGRRSGATARFAVAADGTAQ